MACEGSLTGQYLSGRKVIPVPEKRRKPAGWLTVKGAEEHNLKHIDVRIPLGVLTCVTGVSGSGKSSLVNEILYKHLARKLNRAKTRPGRFDGMEGLEQLDKIIMIDQSPIGRTPRSNPATYMGLFDLIRRLFAMSPEAKARGIQGKPVFLQRQGRALRSLSGRRDEENRDAFPAGPVRSLRRMSRASVQPGDAGSDLAGEEHQRSAGHDGGRGN